jgi:S-adenosylmethionine hydrolase
MNLYLSVSIALIAMTALATAFEPDEKALNLVAILTDFGTTGYYAGSLEGVIYATNPYAKVSAITHEVEPFNVAEGSYILAKSARWYPPRTVFLAEVNPGSGNKYRHVVLETKDDKLFVGPDNGLFSGVMDDLGFSRAFEITNQSVMQKNANSSETFLSLYIYGPVSARLAAGLNPAELGPELDNLKHLPFVQPSLNGSDIMGSIVHVDRYGNLITNIPSQLMEMANISLSEQLNITIGNQSLSASFVRTYGDVPLGDWLALIDSTGDLEVAINMKNAAQTIGAHAGDTVRVSEK